MNKILLSFDLEEFDIPEEFGQKLDENEKIAITLSGLDALLPLLDKYNVRATFYTTAFFAQSNSDAVKKLSARHEIASHAFYHSSFKPEDVLNSKQELEKITGKPVEGFRMPRLMPIDNAILKNAGYSYDSSLNPTYLPGRYNNFNKPKTPFIAGGLCIVPASVATMFRIPLFWLSFKFFPLGMYTSLALSALKKDGLLNLYFHPWEFANINGYKLPGYIKKPCGKQLIDRFELLLQSLKDKGEFISTTEYVSSYHKAE